MYYGFHVVQLNGEQVADMSVYADEISNILFDATHAEHISILKDGFSMESAPTLNELLEIEQKLAALGLIIQA